jgi:hypothetical protein
MTTWGIVPLPSRYLGERKSLGVKNINKNQAGIDNLRKSVVKIKPAEKPDSPWISFCMVSAHTFMTVASSSRKD